MKSLVFILIVISIIVSMFSESKKKAAKEKSRKQVLGEEWARDVQLSSAEGTFSNAPSQVIEKKDFSTSKKVNVNNTLNKEKVSEQISDDKFFDLKKAIIYSAILERPYK